MLETLDGQTSGIWAIRSSSQTVYYINLDTNSLYRARAGSSAAGAGDNQWVPIAEMKNVEIGKRGYYLLDPDGGFHDYRWWLQRAITSIDSVQVDELPSHARETL